MLIMEPTAEAAVPSAMARTNATATILNLGDVPNLTGGVAADGTYTAKAFGRNGYLTVETVISDGRIASVTVTEHTETAGIRLFPAPWPGPTQRQRS